MIASLFSNDPERAAAAWLLNKMARKGYWGHRPIVDDSLLRSARFASRAVNVKHVLSVLVSGGVVLAHHSRIGGKRYSLNTSFKRETLDFIEGYLP